MRNSHSTTESQFAKKRYSMRISGLIYILAILTALSLQASASPAKFVLGTAMPVGNNPETIQMKFNWEPSAGASRYTFEVSLAQDFSKVLAKKDTASNMVVISNLPSAKTIYWRVSAVSASGKTLNAGGPSSLITPKIEIPYKPITIPQSTPKLDGKVSPGEWNKAPIIELENFAMGIVVPEYATPTCRLMWDKTNIYALLEAITPKARPVASVARERDGAVYQDDAFELFFQEKDDLPYHQFIVNASGSLYDNEAKDASWNCEWQSGQSINGAKMTIEVAIPWAAIAKKQPKSGDVWKANLAADFSNQAVVRSWSKVYFFIHDPKLYHAFILGK
jgi:hypothetical protein